MSRYCRTQGQVLSDMHWCEACPQLPANYGLVGNEMLPVHPEPQIELAGGLSPNPPACLRQKLQGPSAQPESYTTPDTSAI